MILAERIISPSLGHWTCFTTRSLWQKDFCQKASQRFSFYCTSLLRGYNTWLPLIASHSAYSYSTVTRNNFWTSSTQGFIHFSYISQVLGEAPIIQQLIIQAVFQGKHSGPVMSHNVILFFQLWASVLMFLFLDFPLPDLSGTSSKLMVKLDQCIKCHMYDNCMSVSIK